MNNQADVVIIGGGITGLAIALELRLRGASVTVLCRSGQQAASQAAAGMLAPMAEGITPSPMLELCQKSRSLYPAWVQKIEEISSLATGYLPSGILAPVFQPPCDSSVVPTNARWLDREAIHYAQPNLSPEVVGGWWYPEDGQVDNRMLVKALNIACETVGVEIRHGVSVTAIDQQHGRVVGLSTSAGAVMGDQYVLAAGAWARELLPLPVTPVKGQMVSVMAPLDSQERLQQVLYGEDSYLVPRQDGRILIGATVESAGFSPGNTPAGLHHLLHHAMRLFPPLADYPIQESWWGFRPATPDELPILGNSHCANLLLALGHYRNGILLAPVTGLLIADRIEHKSAPLLDQFSWDRFTGSAQRAIAPTSTSVKIEESDYSESKLTVHTITRPVSSQPSFDDQPLVIAGRTFQSRLMTGTGKYRNFDDMRHSIAASGCQIVTVAVRRVQTNAPGHEGLADALDWSTIWMLPNTAGCKTADEAIRVARLGREMAKLLGQDDNNFVKLEVIPDPKYLLPDPIGTLQAAEQLVKEGFAVLPYINADPLLAKRLEEVGCATVMPLGSPIGSGQGIRNAANIQIIIETVNVPVVVDAGLGTPSEAAEAMEMGADALLINTAIAQAKDPARMARAMGLAAEAGRLAFLAGRIPVQSYAIASSPQTGTITS